MLCGEALFERLARLPSATPRVEAGALLGVLERINAVFARAVQWNVARGRWLAPAGDEVASAVARAAAHAATVASLGSVAEGEHRAADAQALRLAGFPEELVKDVATLAELDTFLVIEALAAESGADTGQALRAYTELGRVLRLGEIQAFVERTPVTDASDRLAARRLLDQLAGARYELAERLLAGGGAAAVDALAREPRPAVRRYLEGVDRLRPVTAPRNLHPAYLAVQALTDLASSAAL